MKNHDTEANILAVDTSTENCSVALTWQGQLFTRSEVAPRDHTKKILPMVDEVLKEANVKLQDLDALAFGRGPGSFTGVRIGIGIAQGLAFGANLPMIGISTLAAMAQACYRTHQADKVAVAIDARMSEVYWAQFERTVDINSNVTQWNAVEIKDGQQEIVIAPETLVEIITLTNANERNNPLFIGDTYTAGTGWDAYKDKLSALPFTMIESDVLYPEAQDMLVLAQVEWAKGNTVTADNATPTYVRDTVTWKKLPGRE